MAGRRAETLLEMMLFIEMYTLNRAWNGLTDEYRVRVAIE